MTLNWYVGPDRVDAEALARSCSTADYRIAVKQLPTDVDERHADARTTTRRQGHLDRSVEPRLGVHRGVRRGAVPGAGARGPRPGVQQGHRAGRARRRRRTRMRSSLRRGGSIRSCSGIRGNIAERAGLDTTKAVELGRPDRRRPAARPHGADRRPRRLGPLRVGQRADCRRRGTAGRRARAAAPRSASTPTPVALPPESSSSTTSRRSAPARRVTRSRPSRLRTVASCWHRARSSPIPALAARRAPTWDGLPTR